MPLLLFVAFIVLALVELWIVVQVGGLIGVLPTILALMGTSLLGAWLVRREGRRAWESMRTAFASGQWPADQVTQGTLVIFGGALLLVPGFLTDVIGLLAILPPTRALVSALLRRWTAAWAANRTGAGASTTRIFFTSPNGQSSRSSNGTREQVGSAGSSQRRRRPANRPAGHQSGSAGDTPDVEVLSVERDRSDASPE